MFQRPYMACLISMGLAAHAPNPQEREAYQAAIEWASGHAYHWSDEHTLKMPPTGNAFLVSSTTALAPDAWAMVLIHETRVEFADTSILSPVDQLALLHLVAPKAAANELAERIFYAHGSVTLARISRTARGGIYTVQGPSGAPYDAEIEAFFDAITKAPVPFFPTLAGEMILDGSNIHFEDRWARNPVFTFDTHGLVEDPNLRAKWGVPDAAANRLTGHVRDQWVSKLKAGHYQDILAQIIDIHIQGPAWFSVAAAEQWPELAQSLLDKGLDPRIPGPDGRVPLVSACEFKDEVLFESMLQKWGSPVACFHLDENAWDSPLSAAIRSGLPSRIERILSLGADPNGPTGAGFPLEEAIELDSLPAVQTLLNAGAKVTDQELNLARAAGSQGVLDALQKARSAQP